MDADELALWIAWYEQHDPSLAEDWRAGQICAAIANSAFGSKGGFDPTCFFPRLKALARKSEEEVKQHLLAWCANVGGTVIRPPANQTTAT